MRFQNSTSPPHAPQPVGPDAPVLVVGGGIGGLALALGLARSGRAVTLFDNDALALAPDPDAAFAAPRQGAPQVRQSHGLLARLTSELRHRFPDVLEDLFAAGATELPLTGELADAQPDDDELAVLLVRRTTLEWVLRRAVHAEPGVTVRGGARVTGVVTAGPSDPGSAATPTVAGVQLASGELVTGLAVVASTGRRSAVPEWLGAIGVDVPEEIHDTNLVYLTRWYQLPAGSVLDLDPKMAGDLGFVKFLAIPCDGDKLSITIAVPTKDRDLRAWLLQPEAFDRAAAMLPGPNTIFEQHALTPISDVEPLSGLINRLRRFVDDDGRPTVLGFHAIGDAHTCTNPFYGRGCSLALIQAGLLADAFAEQDDPSARAAQYEAGTVRETEPWFAHSVEMDRMLKVGGSSAPDVAEDPAMAAQQEQERADAARGMQTVMAAGATDPVIGRAFLRVFNMLLQPADLGRDPEFVGRVAQVLANPEAHPIPAIEGPTRDELLPLSA
jgi:2-polyprenyl-6-methoxyphenol hydroxylase-like FAD-dependent oxidoreductase